MKRQGEILCCFFFSFVVFVSYFHFCFIHKDSLKLKHFAEAPIDAQKEEHFLLKSAACLSCRLPGRPSPRVTAFRGPSTSPSSPSISMGLPRAVLNPSEVRPQLPGVPQPLVKQIPSCWLLADWVFNKLHRPITGALSYFFLRKHSDMIFSPSVGNVNIYEMGANCLNFL